MIDTLYKLLRHVLHNTFQWLDGCLGHRCVGTYGTLNVFSLKVNSAFSKTCPAITGKLLFHSVHPKHKYSWHSKHNWTASDVLFLFAHNAHMKSYTSSEEVFSAVLKLDAVVIFTFFTFWYGTLHMINCINIDSKWSLVKTHHVETFSNWSIQT